MKLETFYDLSMEDQQQYFGHTFFRIFLAKTRTFTWIWCNSFLAKNSINCGFPNKGAVVPIDLVENPPNFEFPFSGLYNYKNSVVQFDRQPARQSKKGLCSETGVFYRFNYTLPRKKGDAFEFGIDFFRINDLISITELFSEVSSFSLKEAFSQFEKKRPLCFAIDRDFMLSLGTKGKYLELWYNQVPVGIVPSQREIALLPQSLFHQEVVDRFSKEEIKITEGNYI